MSGGEVRAQTSCGSIIEIYGETRYETPIVDCAQPFGTVSENPNLKISYEATLVSEGGTYPFVGTHSAFTLEGLHPEANYTILNLYKVVPEGYEMVNQDDDGKYSFVTPGTYIVVVNEDMLVVTQNVLQKLFAFFIPTAHAFPGISAVVTFTVTEPVVESMGISNILFLPGIQASRLYTKVNGEEERLWEPGGNNDVARLAMNSDGTSIEDIYTKDVIEEKLGVAIGGNVYKGFIQSLVDLDDPSGGPMVTTLPYDWRHDVFDVVENGTKTEGGNMARPIDIIKTSASVSPTKKVTLIAHSNGGLLAKAIMLKLEEEGRANLVDKVIFIASPHIGTPKGLAALLHGYDQRLGFGIIADDEVVRSAIKNMPGVYSLLPSDAYVSAPSGELISFDDSDSTVVYRSKYGSTISNLDEYIDFLKGVEGREDAGDEINKIGATNGAMLESALMHHREQLDNWNAPEGIEVYNIVGTGLPTAKSIEYREFKDSFCDGCPTVSKLEPVLHFTRYGDETVVSKSAKFSSGNILYLNLRLEGAGISNFENNHANITESETTQALVDYILHGSSTEGINFVSTTEPSFSDGGLDIFTIHSPAHIYLKDSAGNITGKTDVGGEWRDEISGSDYFEAGGVKYVLVPSTGAYTIVIEGEGSGVYTHALTTLKNEVEAVHHTYTATVTPTSIITYTKTNNTFSTISVDENGDGETDMEMTLSGDIIEEEVTYDDLRDAIRALNLSRKYEYPLLILVTQAEKLSNHYHKKNKKRHAEEVLLRVVEKQLEQYKKKGIITKTRYREVDKIIDKLIEN